MNKITIIVIAVVVVGAGLFYNFKLKEPAKSSREIKYKVKCESCEISYKNEKGESIHKKVDGQWDYAFTGELNQFVYLFATPEEDGQKAEVKVLRDGDKVAADKTQDLMSPAKAGATLFR